jgi:hypothetical protein
MNTSNKILMAMVVFSFLLTGVCAEGNQPTQQSNKIFLNPFYRASMTNGQNYTYNLTINPPDKISSVSSAIISFDVYISPTVMFNIWVNNIPCNTPNYTISTTYASAGQSRITFDCSNAITKAGNYNITLKPTQQNTGTISGWLDITYMNNPIGKLELSGTEYSPDDAATMFVQLKDSQGLPINNGTCYLDVWYPLNSSGQHPYTIQDAPMLQALGDDGIYYYDMTAPSQLGVYMLSGKCSYSFNWIWFYPSTENIFKPVMSTSVFGTWTGDTLSLNSYDMNFYQCDVASLGNGCVANFTFNLSTYGGFYNVTNINVYYAGQLKGSVSNNWILTLAYWNGTTFVNLSNSLTLTHQAGTPDGVNQLLTNSISTSAIRNNTIILQYSLKSGSGTGTSVYNDWLSIALLSSSGTIQDVRGSSEMHITNIPNATTIQVWNASSRTLTEFNFTVNATINSTAIADAVWSSNATVSPSLLSQFATAFWNFGGSISTNILNLLSGAIWSSTSRNLTYTKDATNYTEVSDSVWNASARYVHGTLAN